MDIRKFSRPSSKEKSGKQDERKRPDLRAGVETIYRDMMKDLIADAEKNIGTKVKVDLPVKKSVNKLVRSRTAPHLLGSEHSYSLLGKAGANAMRPPSQGMLELRGDSKASSEDQARQGGSAALQGAGAGVLEPGPLGRRPSGSLQELVWVARANRISLDTCKQAWELFKVHAPLDGAVNHDQFGKILCKVTGMKKLSDLPPGLLHQVMLIADKDKNGSIDFHEFASWYSTCGFDENMTISAEERAFRDLCRKHNMSLVQVEKYKRAFDAFDEDRSGEVDEHEFSALLRKCAKVPEAVEIPAARFRQLWKEADVDGSGAIDFEEFLIFYNKYFNDETGMGFEGFYRNVRPALGSA